MQPTYPITYFDCDFMRWCREGRCNHDPGTCEKRPLPQGYREEGLTWSDLVNNFQRFSKEPYPGKWDAPLWAPGTFEGDYRKLDNFEMLYLLVYDIDDGYQYETARAVLEDIGLASLIYTTASHTKAHHKFRVVIPLSHGISDPEDFRRLYRGTGCLFNEKIDASCNDAARNFFLPGQYASAEENLFHEVQGDIPAPEDLIWSEPDPEPQKPRKRRMFRRPGRVTLYSAKALEKYRVDRLGRPHVARFNLMLSIAACAAAQGRVITAEEIREIYNQVDLAEGDIHQNVESQRKAMDDARKALRQHS